MNRSLITFGLSLAVAGNSFGYSGQGHQGIAEFAHGFLSPSVSKTVDDLINGDEAEGGDQFLAALAAYGKTTKSMIIPTDIMGQVAIWADDVKFSGRGMGPLKGNPIARTFLRHFPGSNNWHFLNLPLQAVFNDEITTFTPNTDNVVDAINGAINVLEGKPSGFGNGIELTKAQALKAIIHLVGDIHQPLHVGTGYYQNATINGSKPVLEKTPADCVDEHGENLPDDVGGNSVMISRTNKALELHAFWDDTLVENYAATGILASASPAESKKDPHVLARLMKNEVGNDLSQFATDGDYHEWATAWANDSLAESEKVYDGISFDSISITADPKDKTGKKTKLSFIATLPDNYAEQQADRAKGQLQKAGAHLAQLLNSIKWQN